MAFLALLQKKDARVHPHASKLDALRHLTFSLFGMQAVPAVIDKVEAIVKILLVFDCIVDLLSNPSLITSHFITHLMRILT